MSKGPDYDAERLVAAFCVAVCTAFILGYMLGTMMTKLSGGPS